MSKEAQIEAAKSLLEQLDNFHYHENDSEKKKERDNANYHLILHFRPKSEYAGSR